MGNHEAAGVSSERRRSSYSSLCNILQHWTALYWHSSAYCHRMTLCFMHVLSRNNLMLHSILLPDKLMLHFIYFHMVIEFHERMPLIIIICWLENPYFQLTLFQLIDVITPQQYDIQFAATENDFMRTKKYYMFSNIFLFCYMFYTFHISFFGTTFTCFSNCKILFYMSFSVYKYTWFMPITTWTSAIFCNWEKYHFEIHVFQNYILPI